MPVREVLTAANLSQKLLTASARSMVRLSPTDLARLVRYSEAFFRTAPRSARQIARLTAPPGRRVLRNDFAITYASLLSLNALHVIFAAGDIRDAARVDPRIDRFYDTPAKRELAVWSRRYVNGMPKDLRLKIFEQKLLAQRGYLKFEAAHPSYELVDVIDLSSGRYTKQRSVYKLVFIDRRTGKEVVCLLKPPVKSQLESAAYKNEVFYSQYLKVFQPDPVEIHLYDDLSVIEFVDGMGSNRLLSGRRLNPEYAGLVDKLLTWFAQAAALADAVSKGDRDIGVEGGLWGNFILALDETGRRIVRIVSIDHEYVFNPEDRFAVESAEKGYLEMNFLASLPDFADAGQRQALFERFSADYKDMYGRICQKQAEIEALIEGYYGKGEELAIFRSNLTRDPDAWLELLFGKVELFWQKSQLLV
ncbi:hypothetical protein ACFL5U_00315 [Candidatus Margulisiibacteriota bacterium]